ncbi:hypothetical protein JCM6882_003954 [Rhodosporidiobolus microsporus]
MLRYEIEVDFSDSATCWDGQQLSVPGPQDTAEPYSWRLVLHKEANNSHESFTFGGSTHKVFSLKGLSPSEDGSWAGVSIVAQASEKMTARRYHIVEHLEHPKLDTIHSCTIKGIPSGCVTTLMLTYRITGLLERINLEHKAPKLKPILRGLAQRTSGEFPQVFKRVPSDGRSSSGIPLQKHPHDLRLFFPNVGKDGAELWTSSALLSSASPYFKDLLSSDFFEATTRHGKRPRTAVTTPPALSTSTSAAEAAPSASTSSSAKAASSARARPPRDFDDSDDEHDDFLTSSSSIRLSIDTSESDLPYREVRITEACFSTYHALLVWLTSGHIDFAALRSAISPASITAQLSARDKALASSSSLPLPVSPKSVYRLAHFLSLPDLQSAALTSFSSQLTADNTASELFGDACLAYEGLREAALQAAVKKWARVKESMGMKDVEAAVLSGEMGNAAPVLMQLLKATSK